MRALFFRMPFDSGDVTAPIIDSTKVSNLLPAGVELDARDHWIFGSDANSLVGLLEGSVLTPKAGLNNQPAFQSNYMTIPDGGTRGLATAYNEPAAMTWALVIKARFEGEIQYLAGTYTGDDLEGGATLMNRIGNSPGWQVRDRGTDNTMSFRTPAGVEAGDWVFLCGSVAPGVRWGYGGDEPSTSAVTRMPSVPLRKVALGNAYYDSGGSLAGMDVAEFIYWERGLTGSEMIDVYIRSKDRMRDRGITVA